VAVVHRRRRRSPDLKISTSVLADRRGSRRQSSYLSPDEGSDKGSKSGTLRQRRTQGTGYRLALGQDCARPRDTNSKLVPISVQARCKVSPRCRGEQPMSRAADLEKFSGASCAEANRSDKLGQAASTARPGIAPSQRRLAPRPAGVRV
jgi:hypothetical protein